MIQRGPLTDYERALIDSAINNVWNWALAASLREAVEQRGVPTNPWDAPGTLVEILEEVGRV